MGFSVSGSLVLVFLGLFVALSVAYGATSDAMERVAEAESDGVDRLERVQNTDVDVTSVTVVDTTNCNVAVTAENVGETTLDVNETDLLYDNEYRTGWRRNATVEAIATDLWHPGEELTITTYDHATPPSRIRLVTGPGVTQTEVRSLSC
jgi:flagellar protein FlaF